MSVNLPIYFAKDLYHRSKVGVKGVFDSFGLVWDVDEKCWIGESGKVVGTFQGHKKPALLNVSGSDAFLNEMKEFANSVGAEIREVEIKDIRARREEEQDERRIIKAKEDYIKNKKSLDEKESLDNVIKSKIGNMELWGMSKTFMRNWIKLEFGADISEMLGIEPVVNNTKTAIIFDKYNKKEPIKAKGLSILCKNGDHEGCGGYGCSCSCHE